MYVLDVTFCDYGNGLGIPISYVSVHSSKGLLPSFESSFSILMIYFKNKIRI